MRSDGFMNAEDVARYLSLGKNTVYQLAKTGRLSSYHVGRKLRFTLEDVEAYVASTHCTGGGDIGLQETHGAAADDGKDISRAASFGDLKGDPFIIAGDDASADMVASALNESGALAARKICGSYTALVNVYARDADAAVIQLYDHTTNSCNLPYVRRLAPGVSVAVFRLYGCKQGFIVQEGNPRKLNTWGSLLREGIRLANRPRGSSSRVLLDEKLRSMEARSEAVDGYETHYETGNAAAKTVAIGAADVAVGIERDTRGVANVQFLPMQAEWVDLVVRKEPESRAVINRLKELLVSESLRKSISTLGPYDDSKLGVIVYES